MGFYPLFNFNQNKLCSQRFKYSQNNYSIEHSTTSKIKQTSPRTSDKSKQALKITERKLNLTRAKVCSINKSLAKKFITRYNV
ncbi:hypothetical protein HanRHA438_Chr17g0820511 [Helianthus annuus]|nr:hypothetical protein HanRHA438_Chr17g0820511 [Helianthus annuus]